MDIQNGTVLLLIEGNGCVSCYELAPVLNRVANAHGVRVERADAETLGEAFLTERNIMRAPTVLLMKDGVELGRFSGYQPEEILELWLVAKLGE
jgi:thiol-disulfide isomerase/thioredoxin